MLSQRLYQRLYEEGCADATPPADYNQDMNEAFEQDAASFPAVNAPSLWDSFAAPVSNTNNPGQYDPQHPNSQVAQQFVPPRPAMEVSPSPSFAALPGSSSVELTEEEFRELQHKRLDKYLNSVLQKPEAAIMLDRSQSDQGARFMAVHRPTSSRSLDGNGQTPAVQDWQMQPQRPCTPLQKNGPEYSPVTPAQTPHSHHTKPAGMRTPVRQFSPCSEHSTIKASRTKSGDAQAAAGALHSAMNQAPLSPPGTVRVGQNRKFDATSLDDGAILSDLPVFHFPASTHNELTSAVDFQPNVRAKKGRSKATNGASCQGHKANVSSASTFDSAFAGHSNRSSVDFGAAASPSNMTPGRSSDELEPGMLVEDTGVSQEQIDAYIKEDPDNPKKAFSCTFQACRKTFGRRENVRSHIQTHLNDRPFRCLECGKSFVRSHDLKRHFKTHSDVKPYDCKCGSSFARADALGRHLLRRHCQFGLPGPKPIPAKRGRPRKNRPDDEQRANKSARQRKRNAEREQASPASGTTAQSSHPSPAATSETVEEMEIDQGNQGNQGDQGLDLTEIRLFNAADFEKYMTGGETQLGSIQGSVAGSPPGLSHSSPPDSAQLLDCDDLFEMSNTGRFDYGKDVQNYGDFGDMALFGGNLE